MSDNLEQIGGVWAREGQAHAWRRIFDFFCAGFGLLVLSPLLILIAIGIKAGDGGPVFYRQQRIGKNFRPFWLLKFRTMIVGADRTGLLTAPGDARVTRIGSFLRKYKIDELPQLLNVVAGDMQLVGARPEVSQYVEMFRSQYSVILQEAPGITDPASLAYRDEEKCFTSGEIEQQYVAKILPHKLELSLQYQGHRTFFSDLRMLFRTVFGLS